ncbi:hypothetical protein [Gimesia panareensis]|uniref:hypothetical protein n=1 Tax=Gimesia panareensis TaxID=2527978 RepID=UPI00119E047C|nr:hypothetical protein [Gimesia panareensis]
MRVIDFVILAICPDRKEFSKQFLIVDRKVDLTIPASCLISRSVAIDLTGFDPLKTPHTGNLFPGTN